MPLCDVALSMRTVIGPEGDVTVLAPTMDSAEAQALLASAAVLRQAIGTLR